MATYGRYDVIIYPSFYAITDMVTHQIVARKTDRDAAHREAGRRQRRDERRRRSRRA